MSAKKLGTAFDLLGVACVILLFVGYWVALP
jgi:hypothetical protein